jgi:uncharacterized short protein YbdD (DUF466 family)
MQFSNRANARRHEKNIHKLKPNPIGPSIHTQQVQDEQEKSSKQQAAPMVAIKKLKVTSALDIDYTKPELYRHLLTPSKLQFILSNLNFLEQAQDMKCKCCNKQFPSYKFFMGHMRKKYHGLPRNVCFKCLKQFDSKGQFIGHLKRPGGTCPNLYRLVMADEGIPKNLMPSDTNLRTPAKDVLANRVYACAICDDTFRLKSDFREHVYRTHLEVTKNRETPNASCINCNESFNDSAVRRRHFNNLECIVYIVCNTCGEQFPTQAVYLEHVYQTHLKSQEGVNGSDEILFEEPSDVDQPHLQTSMSTGSTKNVQKCPVCNKQYNNYYNVLRHMEAKHPDQVPQTYQCPECPDEKFSKQTYLREHLIKVHNLVKVDVSPRQLLQHKTSSAQKLPAYVCKVEDCGVEFRERAKWLDHQQTEHEGQIRCMFCNHIDDDRDSFEKHLEVHQQPQSQIESEDENNVSQHSKIDAEQTKSYKCRQCNKRIATKTGLQKHMIKVHHIGGELVKCTLCPADFANDKGLKVHLWRCHEIREADYENVLPPDLLDPYTQQQRKLKQEEEQKSILMANESGNGNNVKTFECPLCHIVYTSRDELAEHQKSIHAMDDVDVFESDEQFSSILQDDSNLTSMAHHVTGDDDVQMIDEPEYWFQCRFCQRAFNSSKKLTIHMNSHQEGGGSMNGPDEHGAYPCKECNMIYKSKKSLWVHRHKKHPRIPSPSPCDACEKTFFDKTELIHHMQQVHPGSIPNNADATSDGEPSESFLTDGHWLLDSSANDSSQLAAKHEPTVALNVPKKRKRPAPSEDPSGAYVCDMCPKAFSNANALQVHRGWHFRSPDGRKVKDPSQMWMPDQVPPSKVRRTATTITPPSALVQASPICPHCDTKFASQNNLRRHIIEVHKKNQDGNDLADDAGDEVQTDRVGECTKCNLTFSTVAEWVDHKINDAKIRKTSFVQPTSGASHPGGYEWSCEICLKIFTRKERLLQHMLNHLNDREMDPEVIALHNQKQLKNGVAFDDDDDDSSENEDDISDDNEEKTKPSVVSFNCELCRVKFASSQELRAHVADHFLNGGAAANFQQEDDTSELDIDEEVEQELNEVELEEAQVDYQTTTATNSNDEDESSSEDENDSEESPVELQPVNPPLPKIQVQVHRCRICNAAYLDNARAVECMMNHQKPTNHKCKECQLYFIAQKHLLDHEKLCHS